MNDLTDGKGPEKCIDAVGMEAHSPRALEHAYDRLKQSVMLESDRASVLREMIYVCRPAGILSIPAFMVGLSTRCRWSPDEQGLTIRTGQTHVNRWTDDLVKRIDDGQIDPSFVITHRAKLDQGPEMYKTFRDKKDNCIKVVLRP